MSFEQNREIAANYRGLGVNHAQAVLSLPLTRSSLTEERKETPGMVLRRGC